MRVMSFGLCNALGTFQRVMDRTLYRSPHCESYVDDSLVFSTNLQSHQKHLKEVFGRFKSAGLQLRREKCRIRYTSIEFLGYRISFQGRSPIIEYTQKLHSFPQPNNVAELERFMGTANYYRCYIENMSSIAEPLYNLIKRSKPWVWDGWKVSESI